MKETKAYRPTEWIDPRVEIRPSPIHGKGMFATGPIRQGEVASTSEFVDCELLNAVMAMCGERRGV